MEYEADREKDKGGEPSLAEMTEAAIKRLQQNENGFVLMVEGGRIDHAHHAGNAARALIDTVAFDQAIKTALDLTSRDDTLIVVTADHSHTFFIQGYPSRGNPILGLATDEVRRARQGRRRQALHDARLCQRTGRRVPGAAEGCSGRRRSRRRPARGRT